MTGCNKVRHVYYYDQLVTYYLPTNATGTNRKIVYYAQCATHICEYIATLMEVPLSLSLCP